MIGGVIFVNLYFQLLYYFMELSDFLESRLQLPSLPTDYKETAEWEENHYFNIWIKQYPEIDHEDIRDRLKYIRSYVLQSPDLDGFDELEWTFSQAAMNYYEDRDQRIQYSCLSEQEFYDFSILQKTIKDLGLSPKPTFEFIVFVWHELMKWLNGSIGETIDIRIKRIIERIDTHPNDEIKIDIKVGNKHYYFRNNRFIKSLLALYTTSNLATKGCVEMINPTKREVDYILVRTILEYLPIKYRKEKKGQFTQAERNLGLCVLWLTGEINHKKGDDPTDFCTKDNNATFDKLMRDYKDMPLPIISPLF